jgi:DNA-binding response OmpR family regulator
MDVKFLIVDDEESLTYFLRQTLLLEFPGSQVDVAHSGEEGLSLLAACHYDLIIADLRMPGFSGFELVKGVRYLNADVPIVLMTGYGSESIREQATRLGIDGYVEKPFDVHDLLDMVRQLLSDQNGAGA